MKKLTFLFILSCFTLFAQEPITTKLGDFNTLKVYNGLHVTLKSSQVSKVEIFGKHAQKISVINANGTLKIKLRITDGFIAEDAEIFLYYAKDIQVLDANEGSTITSNETIQQQQIEVKVQEGSNISVPVSVKYLTVKAVTGGIVKLSGTTQNQTVEATTGGIYNGYDLESKQSVVTAASGAIAEVYSSEVLDGNVRLGGVINYKGKPEVLKRKKILGGTIKDKN